MCSDSIALVPVQIDTEFIYAKEYAVYNDTLLVVLNSEKTRDYFIKLYSLNSQCLISNLFRKGNGPGEMLGCMMTLHGSCLTVYDFVKNAISLVDIGKYPYETEIHQVSDIHVPFACGISTGKYIALNPYCFDKGKIRNRQPRILVGELPDPIEVNLPGDIVKTYNVSQGMLVADSSGCRFAFFSDTEPLVEFYDETLKKSLSIEGPDILDIEYTKCSDGSMAFSKNFPVTYQGAAANDRMIVASYVGEWYRPELAGMSSCLFLMDWEGTLKHSYRTSKFITSLSLSRDGKRVYANVTDDGIHKLYRADF